VKSPKAFYSILPRTGTTTSGLVWVLAVFLLLSAGITYRVIASHLRLVVDTPITLPVPLSAFPAQIGNWVGRDLPIPLTTKEYMEKHFADDFLSRRYINDVIKGWADVYIVYCSSRPGGILGHQPRVCYPGYGWIHDSTEPSQFISRAGQQICCLIHRFHKPAPNHDEIVVLNFYIVNGRVTDDESVFTGLGWRTPNIAGDPAHYVAQVQISSVLENSVRAAAKNMTELILDFFPNENGEVRAAKYTNTTMAVPK